MICCIEMPTCCLSTDSSVSYMQFNPIKNPFSLVTAQIHCDGSVCNSCNNVDTRNSLQQMHIPIMVAKMIIITLSSSFKTCFRFSSLFRCWHFCLHFIEEKNDNKSVCVSKCECVLCINNFFFPMISIYIDDKCEHTLFSILLIKNIDVSGWLDSNGKFHCIWKTNLQLV